MNHETSSPDEVMSDSAASAQSQGSYRRILSATSLLGGATAINVIIGMARSKLVAVLLGPAGVGLMGTYQSVVALIAAIVGGGLGFSGVREIAEARGCGDVERTRNTIFTLRSLCLVLGLTGTLLLVAAAWPAALFTFKDASHAIPLALLSVMVGIGVASSYFTVLIQSEGRIKDLVKVNVIGGLLVTVATLGCFALWGRGGIVPAMIAGAVVQCATTVWYARGSALPMPRADTVFGSDIAKRLFSLGGVMVFLGIASNLVLYLQRRIIMSSLGEESVGVFQAATSLSGLYAGYVLGAMGTDFLPRLSAVAHDHPSMNRLVNEQTSVALLLGLPGIVGTILMAPLIVPLFYSEAFAPAVPVLQWMSVGIFGRLLSWPMAYVMIAKHAVGWNIAAEVFGHVVLLLATALLIPISGVSASGFASIASYMCYTVVVWRISANLTGCKWTSPVTKLVTACAAAISMSLALVGFYPNPYAIGFGVALLLVVCVLCLRALSLASGLDHVSVVRKLRALLSSSRPRA